MEDKEKFTEFIKSNTSSAEEARVYFNLCSFIAEHGDGRVRSDFQRLSSLGILTDSQEEVDAKVDEAVRLLKQYRSEEV